MSAHDSPENSWLVNAVERRMNSVNMEENPKDVFAELERCVSEEALGFNPSKLVPTGIEDVTHSVTLRERGKELRSVSKRTIVVRENAEGLTELEQERYKAYCEKVQDLLR